MNTTSRRTAPRATALLGSLAVHAALAAVVAAIPATLVAATVPEPDDGPTVLAWIVPEKRADDVVVTPPVVGSNAVPAPAREDFRVEPVVLAEQVDVPRAEVLAPEPAAARQPPSPRPTPAGPVALHPGHG